MAHRIVITGSREKVSPPPGAEWWAARLGAQVVPRGRSTLAELAETHGAWGILVIQAERVTLYVPSAGLEYFYHPGMARRRVRAVEAGLGDPMVTAMGLRPGGQVLDCTLGRATDAIIASHAVGPEGRVVGLESVPVLAAMTEHGLRTGDAGQADVTAAMRRIEVLGADHSVFLAGLEPRAFDVVYFDPVFHQPVVKSSAMAPLRKLADPRPLGEAALARARQVARRAVVVKQRRGTPMWEVWPPDGLVGGRHASIQYGVYSPTP
jgi:hypothetical protein